MNAWTILGFARVGIFLATLLAGCGSPDAPHTVAAPTSVPEPSPTAAPEARTLVYRQDGSRIALVVPNGALLPGCTLERADAWAYVEPALAWFRCDATTERWIQGDPPASVQATLPSPTPAPSPTPQLGASGFSDPVTGFAWILGGTGPFALAQEACQTPFRLPKGQELRDAALRGIFRAADARSGWEGYADIADPENRAAAVFVDDRGNWSELATLKTESLPIFCVRAP